MAAGRGRSTPAPRPGAAQRAAAQEAQRKADEEARRQEEQQQERNSDRASADNLPANPAADPNDPDAGERPLFAELTDAATGLPLLIDPAAVAHIGPAVGSVPHPDAAKAAKGEQVMGAVTEISTIGGILLRVVEDIETVASILGV